MSNATFETYFCRYSFVTHDDIKSTGICDLLDTIIAIKAPNGTELEALIDVSWDNPTSVSFFWQESTENPKYQIRCTSPEKKRIYAYALRHETKDKKKEIKEPMDICPPNPPQLAGRRDPAKAQMDNLLVRDQCLEFSFLTRSRITLHW